MRDFYDKPFNEALGILMKEYEKDVVVSDAKESRFFKYVNLKNLRREQPDRFRGICYGDFWLVQNCQIITYFWLAEKIFNLSIHFGRRETARMLNRALRGFYPRIGEKKEYREDVIDFETIARTRCVDSCQLLAALRSEAGGWCRLTCPAKHLERALVRAYR
jgi:hypothetical protein